MTTVIIIFLFTCQPSKIVLLILNSQIAIFHNDKVKIVNKTVAEENKHQSEDEPTGIAEQHSSSKEIVNRITILDAEKDHK